MTYQLALHALADPTRRELFVALNRKPSSVSGLASAMPVSRPAVSQHLRVLSDAGLVSVRSRGTRRIYSARLTGLEGLRSWLERFWEDRLSDFATEVARQQGERE